MQKIDRNTTGAEKTVKSSAWMTSFSSFENHFPSKWLLWLRLHCLAPCPHAAQPPFIHSIYQRQLYKLARFPKFHLKMKISLRKFLRKVLS